MKKSDLRAECTMLDDEACEARAAATELADKVEAWKKSYDTLGEWCNELSKDVRDLARENDRLKRAIRLISKSL